MNEALGNHTLYSILYFRLTHLLVRSLAYSAAELTPSPSPSSPSRYFYALPFLQPHQLALERRDRVEQTFVIAAIDPMAGVKTILVLFVGLFVLFLAKSAGSNDCRANQEVSCESLRSPKGFTYTVPLNITCLHENCEQGWYFQNGTLIVDSTPNAGGERPPTVQDVTPKNLTVTVCENLEWQLNCGTCECNIGFTVPDTKQPPAHDSHDKQDDNHNDNGKSYGLAFKVFYVNSPCYLITLIFCYLFTCIFSRFTSMVDCFDWDCWCWCIHCHFVLVFQKVKELQLLKTK